MTQDQPFMSLIAQHGPSRGPFVAQFALPLPAPPTLRGPNGEVAGIVEVTGETAIYAMPTIAEALAPFRRPVPTIIPDLIDGEAIYDVPVADWQTELPPKALSVALLEHLGSIVPTISYLGTPYAAPNQSPIVSNHAADGIENTWSTGRHVIQSRSTAFAGMPFVVVEFVARTRDGQPDIAPLTITWPADVQVVSPPVLRVGLLGIGHARAVILLTAAVEQIVPGFAALSELARHNAARGPWYGMPRNWPRSTLLGWPIVRGDVTMLDLARQAIAERGSTPWAGRDNPNPGGTDACFGVTFTGPIWNESLPPDPRILRTLEDCALRWCDRPMHYLEPDTDETLRFDPERAKTVTFNRQQPYDRVSADALRIGQVYQGPAGNFHPFDHEHRSAAPLAVGFALLGGLALRTACKSMLASEHYERSMSPGYPEAWGLQTDRGTGRPIVAANLIGRALGIVPTAINSRRVDMITRYVHSGPSLSKFACKVWTDRENPWPGDGYVVPYEIGQVTAAMSMVGDPRATLLQLRFGRTVAMGCSFDAAGQLVVAYQLRWNNGEPPRSIEQDFVPASGALSQWVGVGLKCYIEAFRDLRDSGLLDAHDAALEAVWIPHAKRAIAALQDRFYGISLGEISAATHYSLNRTLPNLLQPEPPA